MMKLMPPSRTMENSTGNQGPVMIVESPPSSASTVALHEFDTAVRQYGPRFLAVARRYFPCEAECADAVQDAFVSALKQLPRFRGVCRIETWLHRIVVNACLMRLRAQSRRHSVPLSLDLVESTTCETLNTDALDVAEMRTRIREALNRLPDSQRTVIQLRYFEGFTTNETAELLGTNAAVVKTRLHRGCRLLRGFLEGRSEF